MSELSTSMTCLVLVLAVLVVTLSAQRQARHGDVDDDTPSLVKRIFCNPSGCGNSHSGKRNNYPRIKYNMFSRMGKRDQQQQQQLHQQASQPSDDDDVMTSYYDTADNDVTSLNDWLTVAVKKQQVHRALMRLRHEMEAGEGSESDAVNSNSRLSALQSYGEDLSAASRGVQSYGEDLSAASRGLRSVDSVGMSAASRGVRPVDSIDLKSLGYSKSDLKALLRILEESLEEDYR